MKKFSLLFVMMGLIAGCSTNNLASSEHSARNSLSWGGVYQGELPCADCEGINTTLILNYDDTFLLTEEYKKGAVTYMPQTVEGNIVWDEKNPSLISVGDKVTKRVFFVGENYVESYQLDKQPIETLLNYILTQTQQFDITDVTKMVEIAPQLIDCVGVMPMQCMKVKEKGKDWQLFYQNIEGFKFEPGFSYQLIVQEIKHDNVPADGSTISWNLIKIINKTPVK